LPLIIDPCPDTVNRPITTIQAQQSQPNRPDQLRGN
jgi:hypothetical protein